MLRNLEKIDEKKKFKKKIVKDSMGEKTANVEQL